VLHSNDHEGISDIEGETLAVLGIDVQHELQLVAEQFSSPARRDRLVDAWEFLRDQLDGLLALGLWVKRSSHA